MKIKHKLALHAVLFGVFFLAFNNLSLDYSFLSLEKYLGVLLVSSTVVFTIMGIWIALLYPNAINKIVNPDKIVYADFSDALHDTKRLEGLVASVLRSCLVVLILMVLYLFDFFYGAYGGEWGKEVFKSSGLALVMTATLLQFESLWYVVLSNVLFISELHRKREDRQADNDV
tara:strand:- start:791 stop:1309 length:519 start_codon:yes stop_codon:yes gene_type:complete